MMVVLVVSDARYAGKAERRVSVGSIEWFQAIEDIAYGYPDPNGEFGIVTKLLDGVSFLREGRYYRLEALK